MKKFINKKGIKSKIKKGVKGSISIFLCLILTPFLSIALGLSEYVRYQETLEVVDEVYEVTALSTLSGYDEYIHKRFGILAVTQEVDLGEDTEELLQNNMKVLGNQVTVDNVAVTGDFALSDTEVLTQQLVDFSELTSLSAILADDFNLDELLSQITSSLNKFNSIVNTVNSLADLADAITTAVEKLKEFQTALLNLDSSISTAKTSAETLANRLAAFYKKLNDNGITLPQDATLEEIDEAIGEFSESYVTDLINIYRSGRTLIDNLNAIKTNLTTLKTSAEAFTEAVEKAREAAEAVSGSNEADEDGSNSEGAQKTLEEALGKMETLVEESISNITDSTIQTAKTAVDEIINSTLESVGLTRIYDRYYEIINGTYFALPLTDTAKQDVIDLLKTAKSFTSSGDTTSLETFFKDKFVPNINIDIEELKNTVAQIIEDAATELGNSVKDEILSLLTKLVNIVNGLFNLDVFYNDDLNAFVNISGAGDNPYQKFLNAVGDLFTAIDDLKKSMTKKGLGKILEAIKAMANMFKAVGNVIVSIGSIIGNTVEQTIKFFTESPKTKYERLLMSGYMRHNLPCRVSVPKDKLNYDSDGSVLSLALDGSGITGFDYNEIARPPLATFKGQSGGLSSAYTNKFLALKSFLDAVKKGHGTDPMFKGAELEYIYAGTNSELANQTICFFDLYFLRLILGIASVFTDPAVSSVAAAASIASWVVYILYILAEPFCDTVLLVNGANIPVIKQKCWLTATGVVELMEVVGSEVLEDLKDDIEDFASDYEKDTSSGDKDSGDSDKGTGMFERGYQTHMLILLFLKVDPATQVERLKGLIELETKEYYSQNGMTFNMNEAYTAVTISADTEFNVLLDLGTASGSSPLDLDSKIKLQVSY